MQWYLQGTPWFGPKLQLFRQPSSFLDICAEKSHRDKENAFVKPSRAALKIFYSIKKNLPFDVS